MDENQNNLPQNPEVVFQDPNLHTPNRRKRYLIVGIAFFAVIILVGVLGAVFGGQKEKTTKKQQANTTESSSSLKSANSTSGAIVYGFWANGQSIINVVNLKTNKTEPIAILPLNIKHVKVITPQKISYIKNTDVYDRGTQVVSYDIVAKRETVLFTADSTYGIDDYVISPNKSYMAVWEAKNGSSGTLTGGGSRVYSVQADTQEKHLLYNEIPAADEPVHYPIAIINDGTVFTDRFLPNSGAGWGYGMSKVDFAGLKSTDIPSMENGVYGTQPVVSPDGLKLVFAGYDGRFGSGTEVVNGYRRALVTPNTISTLDLVSLQKETLETAKAKDFFSAVSWNPQGEIVLYSMISKNPSNSGSYEISKTGSSQKLFGYSSNSQTLSKSSVPVLLAVSGNTLLVSEQAVAVSSLGNLGSVYSGATTSMFLSQKNLQGKHEITLDGPLTQFISFEPDSYFTAVAQSHIADTDGVDKTIQIFSFFLKPNLAPEREHQQSDPVPPPVAQPTPYIDNHSCFGMAATSCNYTCGSHYGNNDVTRSIVSGTDYNGKPYDSCFVACIGALKRINGSCIDSPLYLYGKKNTKVQVQVGVPIENSNASYVPETGFGIQLLGDGVFTANNKQVESLSFDYISPVKKLERPIYGSIVAKTEVEDVLKKYAASFGLNKRETTDLLLYAKEHLNSPYAFISFYDDELSKKILPLSFSPNPDHYRNIVFYFERFNYKPEFTISAPVFEKVSHDGFSAIEISYILK